MYFIFMPKTDIGHGVFSVVYHENDGTLTRWNGQRTLHGAWAIIANAEDVEIEYIQNHSELVSEKVYKVVL